MISFFFLSFLLIFLALTNHLSLIRNYSSIFSESFLHFSLGASLDSVTIFFLIIVLSVTRFVCCYRTSYIEHYNNFKFIFLLLRFFSSMVILSLRRTMLALIIGWDGLGITSICLIIFYPNNTTLFNSILTMFFNRLGDVILILCLGVSISNYSMDFRLIQTDLLFFLLLCLCSFTKRAQFPLSSWLPAAISAPTPISAIVHSSTLVTAGILILMIFHYSMGFYGLIKFILFFSRLTFLIGGFTANLEKDFKKIVAFSTIRQISIIFCFLIMGFFSLGCFHILFHAFFKTLLFCCSGLIFITKFRDQFKKFISPFFSKGYLGYLLLCRLFGITGLTFSSSFFSKDKLLESVLIYDKRFFVTIIVAGTIFTIFYCSSLFISTLSRYHSKFYEGFKSYPLIEFFLFSILILFFSKLFCYHLFESSPCLNWTICSLLGAFLLYFLKGSNFNKPSFNFISYSIWGIKIFSYSIYSKIFSKDFNLDLFYRRDLFFSIKNFSSFKNGVSPSYFNRREIVYILFLLTFTLIYSSYLFSLIERNIEAVEELGC